MADLTDNFHIIVKLSSVIIKGSIANIHFKHLQKFQNHKIFYVAKSNLIDLISCLFVCLSVLKLPHFAARARFGAAVADMLVLSVSSRIFWDVLES